MERRGEAEGDTQLGTEGSFSRRFIPCQALSAFHELENHDALFCVVLALDLWR